MWMNYIISPEANATATVCFGEAPVTRRVCADRRQAEPGHCETFHATDEEYWKNIYFWNTPSQDCVDGADRRECTGFATGPRPGPRSRASRRIGCRDRPLRGRSRVAAAGAVADHSPDLTAALAARRWRAWSIDTRASSWARSSPLPTGWLGRRLPRVARRSCSSTPSGRPSRSPRWSSRAHRSTTSDDPVHESVYRTVTLRTVGMAALVTATASSWRFPIAFYMAKVASVRMRGVLVVSPCSCRCGRATCQGLLVARDPVARAECSTGCWLRSGSRARAMATWRSGSYSPTSGCRS